MSVIDLSKVSEITLGSDDLDSETVLKTSALWGNPANFKQVKFPKKLAKNLHDFTGDFNICREVLPTFDKHWLFHLYMDENRDMIIDVFNGEDRGLVYINGKAFIKGSNSFNVTNMRRDSRLENISLKAFDSLNKILVYTVKNNIADIWYISNEWDYAYDVNNLDESVKDIVKALPKGNSKNVDLLVEDVYKRGTAMVYKYPWHREPGKWVQNGEYCLVIC
jgi:hypothetical protein